MKELQSLLDIETTLNTLLRKEEYIARSEYQSLIQDSYKIIEYFYVLKSSDMLKAYCRKHHIQEKKVSAILSMYANWDTVIEEHNESFIQKTLKKEKKYLDTILKEIDPNITLDQEQRRVVLTDEDHCLVIAGAGAGKTTTIAAKVKYLIEKKHVDPKQILVVSFTNKAVNELREKINEDLHIECPITTFHSTGNAILRKQTETKLNIVDSSKLYFVLQDYFQSSLLKNEKLVDNLLLFFSAYFDAPYEGKDLKGFFQSIAKSNYSTLRSDLNSYKKEIIDARTKKKVTIQNEVVRSYQEVEIANYLYLNGIEYVYEPTYKYNILYARKPYTPDFLLRQGKKEVYLEHFGISQEGKNDRYTQKQLDYYKKCINYKIQLHRKHNTSLLYTFSKYTDGRSLLEHLQEQLIECGFQLRPRSNKEIIEKLVVSEESRYIRKLVALVTRFIHNFKTNGYTLEHFDKMKRSTTNVRSKLFLDICRECYVEYERYLKREDAVDFEDMINSSARVLKEIKEYKQKLDFKYIIVDEYQDISRQRFDLVQALSDVCDAKIIAVGDDWQSIYAFSGSDITLFTKFEEKMGYAKMLKIVNTYRNSQEMIDIAGGFIQENNAQIKKELKSKKHIKDPVIIYTYDSSYKDPKASNKSGALYQLAHSVETALEQIITYNKKEGKPQDSSILLLGRFGFDGDRLERSGLFEYKNNRLRSVKYPFLNITFMTAHASKGLGYDNVLLVNGRNEIYGFPAKIEDDPVLSFVVKQDTSYTYAEERRLFYVALTRTKNRVYCIAPQQNPSEFLLEIKKKYPTVQLRGDWNEEEVNNVIKKVCPMCGYPMQYRYKASYGLRLFMCTNEPEICGFMTNEYKAKKLGIMKCNQCRDGYLIVRKTKEEYFLGCTNYKKDGSGCNNTISKKRYYEMMHLALDIKETTDPVAVKEENYTSIPKANISPVMYKNVDLHEVVYTILDSVSYLSSYKYYSLETLMKMLKGYDNKIPSFPYYASLKGLEDKDIYFICEWLLKKKYLLQTKHSKYPVLHPTYKGEHYIEYMTRRKLIWLKKKLEASQ